MSKKDFEALADSLKNVVPVDSPLREGWIYSVQAIVSMCKNKNPRFHTLTFLNACGVTIGEQNTFFIVD